MFQNIVILLLQTLKYIYQTLIFFIRKYYLSYLQYNIIPHQFKQLR